MGGKSSLLRETLERILAKDARPIDRNTFNAMEPRRFHIPMPDDNSVVMRIDPGDIDMDTGKRMGHDVGWEVGPRKTPGAYPDELSGPERDTFASDAMIKVMRTLGDDMSRTKTPRYDIVTESPAQAHAVRRMVKMLDHPDYKFGPERSRAIVSLKRKTMDSDRKRLAVGVGAAGGLVGLRAALADMLGDDD